MTNEVDLATAVAVEVAKQIPVKEAYQDGLSPAVQQTGGALEDFIKTLRLALAPLQFTAALQDRYVRFLDRSVRKIPEEHRIVPTPQIAGPVLEAIKYEPEDTLISDMFGELISRAFDRRTADGVHPAFAPLVRQLSLDEAVILKVIYEKLLNGEYFKYHFSQDWDAVSARFLHSKIEVDELPKDDLKRPDRVDVYIEHLDKLGLASRQQYQNQSAITRNGVQIGTRVFARYQLTEFGSEFMKNANPPA